MILKDYSIQYDLDGKPMFAYGAVYGNPKFYEGKRIRTSTIVKFDEEKMFIETLNNIYYLEKGE